jgi:hypothetical protein
VFVGNLGVNAMVTRLYADMAPGHYFLMLAGAMLVITVAFVFVAQRFNRLEATREASPA